MRYLILIKQRSAEGCALWWRENRSGYTTDTAIAGRYSKEEADSITAIRGEDYPVPEDEIGGMLHTRMVVKVDDADNYAVLKGFESIKESKP